MIDSNRHRTETVDDPAVDRSIPLLTNLACCKACECPEQTRMCTWLGQTDCATDKIDFLRRVGGSRAEVSPSAGPCQSIRFAYVDTTGP